MTLDYVVQTLNDLYITNRRKFILQQSDGSYREVKRYIKAKREFIPILTDNALYKHVEGKHTLGVFAGQSVTKFICFDVDTKEHSQQDTEQLRDTLILDFQIDPKFINISFSGSKGYHVELFFDKPIKNELVETFYNQVLKAGEFTKKVVELRPLHQTGVKLPLGIHKKTGNRCHFVDLYSFEHVEDETYLRTIQKLDTNKFIAGLDLKPQPEVIKSNVSDEADPIEKIEKLVSTLDLTLYEVEHLQENLIEMLETKVLKYTDSRNKYTFYLTIFLKELGHDVEDSIAIINGIMLNTKRNYEGFINSSEHHIKYETQRIVKHAHKKNYMFHDIQRDVWLYEDEIKDILSVKGIHLQRLYLSILIHAKRCGSLKQPFYMAYSVMANMGNSQERGRLRSYISQLSDRIEVKQSNVVDVPRSKATGITVKKPNVYSIKKSFNQNSDQKVLIKADVASVDINEVLKTAYQNNVINFSDIKKHLPKNRFAKFKQSL